MRKPDEDDEEDLRAYASVFARLTSGVPPTPPNRREKLTTEARRRILALAERLRDEAIDRARRVRAESVALFGRVRAHAGRRPLWHLRGHRPNPRSMIPLHREPSIFVGLASFAFAFTVAWWTGGPTDDARDHREKFVAEQAVSTVAAPLPTTGAQPAAWDIGQVLRTPGASEAAQLAVVDELTKDSSDDATRALLAGVDSASLHVSMACLRALSGRSCDKVGTDLARRLDDSQWQRRAWAARVLGANACAGAGRHLRQRLGVEPDLRVQAQLHLAIHSLKEPGA